MTERAPFQTLKDYGDFELRRYPTLMQIETTVQGDFLSAGNLGFRPLVSFISGFNKSGQKIAMTAPVIQEPLAANKHLVRFVLPSDLSKEKVPEAADGSVKVIEVREHLSAVRRFSGSWNQERFQEEGQKLLAGVKKAGLAVEGNLYWSRFDPPWKPGFLKHNEVAVKISEVTTS